MIRGPPVGDLPRGLGHPMRLAAGKLHGGIGHIGAEFGAFAHAGLGLDHFLAGDHLADHQTGAKAQDQIAERAVGDSGHRGQEHGRRLRAMV